MNVWRPFGLCRCRQERQMQAEQAARARMQFTPQQLQELRRLEHERVQAQREFKMGIQSRTDLGVRYDQRLKD